MPEGATINREEMINRLKELVLDHLGMPRPGATKHIQDLQDRLLPVFIERSRHAWLAAASPMPLPNDPSNWSYLAREAELNAHEIDSLNKIFDELGIHDLMQDVADSAEITAMSEMPIDHYDERILKAAGHPNPGPVMKQLLLTISKDPTILSNTDAKLTKAAQASLRANRDINIVINVGAGQPSTPAASVPQGSPPAAPEKPKRRKLFTGLWKTLFGRSVAVGQWHPGSDSANGDHCITGAHMPGQRICVRN